MPRIRMLTEQKGTDLVVGAASQCMCSSATAATIRESQAFLAAIKKFNTISVDGVPFDWAAVSAA